MLYLTCTTITSIDLAHYGVSRAKDWVSVKCGTTSFTFQANQHHSLSTCFEFSGIQAPSLTDAYELRREMQYILQQ